MKFQPLLALSGQKAYNESMITADRESPFTIQEESMKKKQLMVTCGILAAALCLGGCGKIDGTQTVLTVNEDTVSMGAAMFDLRYQQAELYLSLIHI